MKKFIQICFICVFIVCTLVSIININNVYAENITTNTDEQYSIVLGDAIYDDGTKTSFSFPNATFTSKNNAPSPTIFSVTVSDGTVELSSEDSTTLGNATIIKDKGNSKKSVTLMWESNSGSKDVINNIIHTLKFTFVEGMKITITVNGGTTNISSLTTPANQNYTTNSKAITLTQWSENGHYYLYVPYYEKGTKYMTWKEAYNNALDFYLGGMQGYLVTLTIPGEQEYLNNLADANVWTGATVLGTEEVLYTGGSDNPLVKKLNGEKIETGTYLYYVGTPMANDDPNYNNLGFVRAAQTYKSIVGNNNKIDSPLIGYYYWAAGPEAGESVRLKDDSGNTIITLYNNPSTSRELNGGATGPGAMWKWQDMDGYHQWQHESCTAAYVGEVAGFTGFNDIIEGNFKNFDNAAAKGYVVEFGGWDSHDKTTDESGNTNEKIVNFEFGTSTYKDKEPKSTEVEVKEDASVTTTTEGDKIKIIVNNVRADEKYAVIDLTNNTVITDNVYSSDDSTSTLTNIDNWFTKDNNSSTLIWKQLDPSHQYKVVKIKSTTTTTSPSSVTDGVIATLRVSKLSKVDGLTWYSDEKCSSEISVDSRNTSDKSDDGNRTVYLKLSDKYKYTDKNKLNISSATIEQVSDNLYKVTYTIPETSDITITPNNPSLDITGNISVDLSDKTYDGSAISIGSNGVKYNSTTIDSSSYSVKYYLINTDGSVDINNPLSEAPKDSGTYKAVIEIDDSTSKYYGSLEKTITINKASILVSMEAESRAYNGSGEVTFKPNSTTFNGVNNEKCYIKAIGGDSFTAYFKDDNYGNVGTNKPVNLSGDKDGGLGTAYTLEDSDNSGFKIDNYNVTINAYGTITKATLSEGSISAYNKTVIYDGEGQNIDVNIPDSGGPYYVSYYTDESHSAAWTSDYARNVKYKDGTSEVDSYTVYYVVSSNNYNDVSGSATITINPLQVEIQGLIVDDKQYDGTTSATISSASEYTLVCSGHGDDTCDYYSVKDFDDVSVSDTNVSMVFDKAGSAKTTTEVTASVETGEGKTLFSLTGTNAGNYKLIKQPTASAKITDPSIIANDKIYDGQAITVTVEEYSDSNNDTNSNKTTIDSNSYDVAWYSIASDEEGNKTETKLDSAPVDVGTYKVEVSFKSDGNKSNYSSISKEVTIYKRRVKVSASIDSGKTYDGGTSLIESQTITYTLTTQDDNTSCTDCVISADKEKVEIDGSSPSISYIDKNVGENKKVIFTNLSLKDKDENDKAKNYKVETFTATASISKLNVSVGNFEVYDRIYKENDTSASIKVKDGALSSYTLLSNDKEINFYDDVKVDDSGATATFASVNVGYQKVTATGFKLIGADANNYELTQPTTYASITPEDISQMIEINLSAESKIYDGNNIDIESIVIKNGDTVKETIYTDKSTNKPSDYSGITCTEVINTSDDDNGDNNGGGNLPTPLPNGGEAVTLSDDEVSTPTTSSSSSCTYKWNNEGKVYNASSVKHNDAGTYSVEVTIKSDNYNGTVTKNNIVISKRVITFDGITFNDKEYDGKLNAPYAITNESAFSNTVNNQTLYISTSSDTQVEFGDNAGKDDDKNYDDAKVGSGKKVSTFGFDFYSTGKDCDVNNSNACTDYSNNYIFEQPSGYASITKKAIRVKPNSITKTYDGSKTFKFNDISIKGVNDETITISNLSGALTDQYVGEDKSYTLDSGYTITSGDNYDIIIDTSDSKVNVVANPITINISDVIVDSLDTSMTIDYSITSGSLIKGDSKDNLLLLGPSEVSNDDGTYDINLLVSNPNYDITYNSAKLIVLNSNNSIKEYNNTYVKYAKSNSTTLTSPSLNTSISDIKDNRDIITDSDKTKMDVTTSSHTAKIWLELSDTSNDTLNSINTSDKETINKLIKSYVGDNYNSLYFDADLYTQIDSDTIKEVHETGEDISVTIKLPQELINSDTNKIRTYKIIRYHKAGDIEAIDTVYNSSDNTITFKSNKFSTFIIAYSDKDKTSGNRNETNTPCGNTNWTWSEKEGKCVYKASKTSTN